MYFAELTFQKNHLNGLKKKKLPKKFYFLICHLLKVSFKTVSESKVNS